MPARHVPIFVLLGLLGLGTAAGVLGPHPLPAADIAKDPQGFHGIRWGAKLADHPDFVLVTSSDPIQEYELKQGAPTLGEAHVDMMRFSTIEGQFARVTIRYRGQKTHDQVLAYLRATYGPTDRTQGSMMRGLNQQFNWRGAETEVNLTYESSRERGYLFIESRLLAGKFMEHLPTAYHDARRSPAPPQRRL